MMHKKGFALIEILIAVAILSIVLLSVFSGVSTSINVMSGTRNSTIAMIIAKSKLNEFRIKRMRGMDISHEPIEEYPEFNYSRVTERYEHILLGPIPAKKTDIIITWKGKHGNRNYKLSYIYAGR